jgi:hypothetical protein
MLPVRAIQDRLMMIQRLVLGTASIGIDLICAAHSRSGGHRRTIPFQPGMFA